MTDHLKNTSEELQTLENSISRKLQEGLQGKGLIVVGYAGNDNSVMTALEEIVGQGGLPYGIIWCKPKHTFLSKRAEKLMESACHKNEQSGVVDIDGFDDLMYRLYLTMGKSHQIIDERWKETDSNRPILFGGLKKRNVFTKTNTFEAENVPENAYAFETTITSWKELRNHLSQSKGIVAALFKGKVWAFGEKTEIQKTFDRTIKSEICLQNFPENWHQRDYSFVWSMYYDLIKSVLVSRGFRCFGRNKFYDSKAYRNEKGNTIYDGIEIFLSCIGKKILLTILPTFYVEKDNGQTIEKLYKQRIINYHVSKLYNKDASNYINDWSTKLCLNKKLHFECSGFILQFNRFMYTSGGTNRVQSWPEVHCFQCEEPGMCFSVDDSSKTAVNQLKGLVNYGPIEQGGYNSNLDINSIRLAVLTPGQTRQEILSHLEKLKRQFVTGLKHEKYFLPEYIGFEKIYRRNIDIPDINDNVRFRCYDLEKVVKLDAIRFFKGLTRYIDVMSKDRMSFDILIIYIPKCFAHLREIKNEAIYFDLHDSLKLYCADKGMVVQLIEGKSAIPDKTNDSAKIMWGLSTGLYSKVVGRLWKPAAHNKNTAFVGLSYVQSAKNGEKISIGCSQLFDAEGNGMRLYLRPLKNPQMIQENPFMRNEDACRLMLNLKQLYDDSVPMYDLKRVVIHKTTFFTEEEMEGIARGLSGIEDIELLQIQEFTPWRAIRYNSSDMKDVSLFPIQRGTVIQLNLNMFLIWTHGVVQSDELAGKNGNYYKNGRGIPAPLLVRRFMGKSDGATLVNEIMMLTKMNWNSGDSLYKVLPVTLDFAKMLSKVAKQDIVMYDRPYDFRYFM